MLELQLSEKKQEEVVYSVQKTLWKVVLSTLVHVD